MKEAIFTVRFIPKTNCFLYLPEPSLQNLLRYGNNTKCCLQMKYGNNKCAYFSWSPQAHNNDVRSVGISAAYAQALGLKENEEVLLSSLHISSSVDKINVCLTSSDDWDVMEMSLQSVQSSLLNQVRVVWPGQILVVWISKYLHVSIRVDSLHPNTPVGVLETFTDLIISLPTNDAQAPVTGEVSHDSEDITSSSEESKQMADPNSRSSEDNEIKTNSISFWDTILKTLLSAFSSKNYKNSGDARSQQTSSSVPLALRINKSIAPYRVHPLRIHPSKFDLRNTSDVILCQPCNIFVHKRNLSTEILRMFTEQEIVVCKLSKTSHYAASSNEKQDDSPTITAENSLQMPTITTTCEVYGRLHVIEDIYNSCSSRAKKWFYSTFIHSENRCVLVPDSIQRTLKIGIGERLNLSLEGLPNTSKPNSTNIQVTVAQNVALSYIELASLFQEYLKKSTLQCSLLLCSQTIVTLQHSDGLEVESFISLSPPELKYVLLDSVSMHKCNITIHRSSRHTDTSLEKLEDSTRDIGSTSEFFGYTVSKLVSEGTVMLELGLGLQPSAPSRLPSFSSNILIVGNPGSGKSTVARHLCNVVKRAPHFVHCVEVQCSHLKGKTVEALQKLLSQWVADCIFHQPAVLLLDDVDSIIGISSQNEENSAEAVYNFRVGEMLAETLDQVQRRNSVVVVATAPSILKLSPSIAAARGQHFFKTVLQIPDLTKQDRLELLTALITEKTGQPATDLLLDSHASKAEGYVVQDIADMVDKALFEAWKREIENNPIVNTVELQDGDVESAMANTVPLSLRGVTLYKDSKQCWADVGGLTDVKRVLVEALQWPSQYMELFNRCPLRHQSGLLLYGAPGTGKTLLAGAVAHECGLNFISVKGPELLSKYIGASEESVRSIFQKAQSAQPCVLFFDEFDSLAPRRGHDSTGVTDRVVNQLLTQLDGVESLVGVWVVAATSRPDLLDPALLRPGRLDRAIQCSLPETPERLDILRALSRRMRLAPDVDLAVVADGTQGFTGADLQAVLYTAQLAAVEDACQSAAPAGLVEKIPKVEEGVATLGEVTQKHLMAALLDTRPSLSPDEKLRYKIIYDKFVGSRSGKSREMEVVSQRITLA